MSPAADHPLLGVKALTFDVFGTVVDWRRTVTEELILRSHLKFSSPSISPAFEARLEAIKESDWATFAQQWRSSYWKFVSNFTAGRDEFKTIDEHHKESLERLLKEWGLEGMYTENEILSLSLVWHRLEPWDDSPIGLNSLSKAGYTLATLSNGNELLLKDLVDFGSLNFDHLFSAETFKAYKPARQVYLGAAEALALEPDEVAMVACHLGDLEAARDAGLKTIYVEREAEEAWGEQKIDCARKWVDAWISKDKDGLVELAKRLPEVANMGNEENRES